MKILIALAWKNIWRSPTRSLVVMISVILGLWAGMFMVAFTNGLNQQRLEDQLSNSLGHIKVINPKFSDEKLVQHSIDSVEVILNMLTKYSQIQALSPRINFYGMAASSVGSFGVDIYGIDPEKEKQVLALHSKLVEGTYFEDLKRNPILIGRKLADRLNLNIRSKIVLTFQDIEGNITAGAFRVVGIYRLSNTAFEASHVFTRTNDLEKILASSKHLAHQIIMKTDNYREADVLSKSIHNDLPNVEVQSWLEMSPEMAYFDEVMRYFFFIFIGIILLALAMGIINTMLMAVLERTRELGMLMAIGMAKKQILILIIWETFFLTCAGLPIGILLAWASITISSSYGIDLSVVAQGFEALGYSSIIRPYLDYPEYIQLCVMVFFTALISALYPAWKAIQLNPVEAIRKI